MEMVFRILAFILGVKLITEKDSEKKIIYGIEVLVLILFWILFSASGL